MNAAEYHPVTMLVLRSSRLHGFVPDPNPPLACPTLNPQVFHADTQPTRNQPNILQVVTPMVSATQYELGTMHMTTCYQRACCISDETSAGSEPHHVSRSSIACHTTDAYARSGALLNKSRVETTIQCMPNTHNSQLLKGIFYILIFD